MIKNENMNNINRHVNKLKKDGFTVIENILSEKDCFFFKNRSNQLLKKLLEKKKTTEIYSNSQRLMVPFKHDRSFFKLLYFKTVDKIRGMYAIAIYDQAKSCLYLIRDPAGIKPLYYYHDNHHHCHCYY